MTDATAATPKRFLAERLGRFVALNWQRATIGIGTIALAVAGAPELFGRTDGVEYSYFDRWGWPQFVFLGGFLALLVGGIAHLKIRPTYGDLLAERDQAVSTANDRANALESVLRAIITDLTDALNLSVSSARASVYCFSDNGFVLLSRVSRNPEWKKRGRASYPADQGLISKAWRDSSAVLVDLPANRDDWEAQLADLGFSSEVAERLSMQARSLVAIRVDALMGSEKLPVGVLVLESEGARGVNGATLDRLLKQRTWGILQNAMANARKHFPAVANTLVRNPPPAE